MIWSGQYLILRIKIFYLNGYPLVTMILSSLYTRLDFLDINRRNLVLHNSFIDNQLINWYFWTLSNERDLGTLTNYCWLFFNLILVQLGNGAFLFFLLIWEKKKKKTSFWIYINALFKGIMCNIFYLGYLFDKMDDLNDCWCSRTTFATE
jgi:hypothetical protein